MKRLNETIRTSLFILVGFRSVVAGPHSSEMLLRLESRPVQTSIVFSLRVLLIAIALAVPKFALGSQQLVVAAGTRNGTIVAGTLGDNFASCKSVVRKNSSFVLDEMDGRLWLVDNDLRTAALISNTSIRDWALQRQQILAQQKALKAQLEEDPNISQSLRNRFRRFRTVRSPALRSTLSWPIRLEPSAQPIPRLEQLSAQLAHLRLAVLHLTPRDPSMMAVFSCYFDPSRVPFVAQSGQRNIRDLSFIAQKQSAPYARWRKYQRIPLWQMFTIGFPNLGSANASP